jgi:Spy/CpxP family protein refolding chaperone
MRTRILAVVLSGCVAAGASLVGSALLKAQAPAGQGHDQPKSGTNDSRDSKANPRPPFKWWAIDKYKLELKLTNDQSAEIEKIFQASMDRLRVDKDDLDRAQTNFSQLMEKSWAGEREFARAVDQLELARYNVSKERTMMLVRIHNLLTPEQRKGLDAIRKRNEADRNRQH